MLDPTDFVRRLVQATQGDAPLSRTLPCSAWDRWVLVSLYRHLTRQRFVEQVVRERLHGSPERIAQHGYAGHPEDDEGSGRVPGLPEWQYSFHGRGCSLTHDDGITIDVDFDPEHGSASIDPWFFKSFLMSTRDPSWPELQLRSTDGGWEAWMASIQPLRAAGLLDGDHCVRVLTHVHPWCEAVSHALEQAERDDQRRAIALALEDFALATNLDPSRASPSLRELAEQQLEDRCRELEARIAARIGPHASTCLLALRSIDPERARAIALAQCSRGPIDALLSASMRMLDADPHPDDMASVCELLERLRGRIEVPAPFIRVCATRHLLHPYRRATVPEHLRSLVLDALADDQRTNEGEAALLVYLLDRERGLARIRAGRSSSALMTRELCGATLDWIRTGDANSRALGLAAWLWVDHASWLRQWDG